MSTHTPTAIVHVEDLLRTPDQKGAVVFTREIFHGLASGEMQAMSGGETASLRYVVERCLHGGLTSHFHIYGIVVAETAKELERLTSHVNEGTLTTRDTTILSNLLRLSSTSPFMGGSPAARQVAHIAHDVLHGPSRENTDLHATAFKALCESDLRRDAQDWRRFAKGAEHKIAPALLYKLMDKDINEFARAVLQMTRDESKDSFPEGTRDAVFNNFLRPFSGIIPTRLGQEKFNILWDRIHPTANEKEREVLGLISDAYRKLPAWNPEA